MNKNMNKEKQNVEYDLRPIWGALIDIYKEVARICDKYGLRYYAAAGTLIGTCRHNGFIPWDDDLDLMMPREDYRRFFDVVCKELPSNLVAEDFHVQSRRYREDGQFGKVLETNENIVADVSAKSGLSLREGLFVDIFPIDGCPSGKIAFKWWMLRRSVWHWLIYPMSRNKIRNILLLPIKFLWGVSGNRSMDLMLYERWLRKYDFDKTNVVLPIYFDKNAAQKRLIRRADFDPVRMVDFESVQMPIPLNAENMLTVRFGDWHKLPDVSQRKPSHQTF